MHQGNGELIEMILVGGETYGRILCSTKLLPGPGQYVLAHDGSDSPLPVPVFSAGLMPGGFLAAPALPGAWRPGMRISLRGPLGRGFTYPESARRVGLAVFGHSTARLNPLLNAAMEKGAAITVVSDQTRLDLPHEVEVRQLSALSEVAGWSDYLAVDIVRESLPELWDRMSGSERAEVWSDAQILVRTPVPCGGMAECGVCAVRIRGGWKMACKDGPVFDLRVLATGSL